jgi:hypothetical protein
MSNQKVEATYHGRRRAFLIGDWVRVTELPELDHRLGQVIAIQDSMKPYVVRVGGSDRFPDVAMDRAFDWLALTPAAAPGMRIEETTGEHTFHKLEDDLYQDWADDAEGHIALHRAPRPPFPTNGELGLALGIVAFIMFLFAFIVFFYPGW